MNFKKELAKNILFKGINVLLTLVVTVLMTRLLGPGGNGIFSLFVTNTAVIVLAAGFSFNSGLTYYSAGKNYSADILLHSALVVLLIQVLVVAFSERLFTGIFGVSFYLDIHLPGLPVWGLLYLSAILLQSYASAIFTGNKWFDTLNALAVFTNGAGIVVFAFLLHGKTPHDLRHTLLVLKCYILLTVFQAVLNLFFLLFKIRYRFRFQLLNPSELKPVLKYSMVAFLSNLFQFFAYRMDYWFINHFRPKEELGMYALAAKLSQVLWLLPMTIAAVVIPFTVTSSGQLAGKVKKIVQIQFNFYVLLAVILALAAPGLIPLLFSDAFKGTVLPFLILLPGVVIFTLTTVLASYFAGINRQDINLKISACCFLCILVGDLLLVPAFGKEGAAAASSLGYAFSGILSLYAFSTRAGVPWHEILRVRKADLFSIKKLFSGKL